MRAGGITSRYRPKNAIGSGNAGCESTNRYVPPVRTSASQDTNVMPIDLGAHHRLSSSGLVHASNTIRAGASIVRVTTSSRSDRSVVVGCFTGVVSLAMLASIGLLLAFQLLDELVQLVEACGPELLVAL